MKFFDYFDKFATWLAKITSYICMFVVAVMFLHVFLNTLGRNYLGFSLYGGSELPRYLLIILTFLGASVALAEGKHVRLMFGVNSLPPQIGSIVILLGNLMIAFFLIVLMYNSWDLVIREGFRQRMTEIRVLRMVYIYIFIPIGATLMLIHLINQIFEVILIIFNKKGEDALLDKEERIF